MSIVLKNTLHDANALLDRISLQQDIIHGFKYGSDIVLYHIKQLSGIAFDIVNIINYNISSSYASRRTDNADEYGMYRTAIDFNVTFESNDIMNDWIDDIEYVIYETEIKLNVLDDWVNSNSTIELIEIVVETIETTGVNNVQISTSSVNSASQNDDNRNNEKILTVALITSGIIICCLLFIIFILFKCRDQNKSDINNLTNLSANRNSNDNINKTRSNNKYTGEIHMSRITSGSATRENSDHDGAASVDINFDNDNGNDNDEDDNHDEESDHEDMYDVPRKDTLGSGNENELGLVALGTPGESDHKDDELENGQATRMDTFDESTHGEDPHD